MALARSEDKEFVAVISPFTQGRQRGCDLSHHSMTILDVDRVRDYAEYVKSRPRRVVNSLRVRVQMWDERDIDVVLMVDRHFRVDCGPENACMHVEVHARQHNLLWIFFFGALSLSRIFLMPIQF